MSFPIAPLLADEFAFAPAARQPFNPIDGTSIANDLPGTGGRDLIRGLGGHDTLSGLKGNDRLEGGNGNDTLDGGAGNDRVRGGGGNDTVIVSLGADRIDGGAGRDTLDASGFGSGVVVNATADDQGWPEILAGTITLADATVQTIRGIENFLGSRFDDTFYGDAANAVIKGGGGNDRLEAYGDQAKVLGGAGDDILEISGDFAKVIGGAGDDILKAFGPSQKVNGGAGSDEILFSFGFGTKVGVEASVIKGGGGNDRLVWLGSDVNRALYPEVMKVYGGAGSDTFVFSDTKTGTIQDFQSGIDKVDLTAYQFDETATFDDLMLIVRDTANGAVLRLDGSVGSSWVGPEIVFKGLTRDDLADGDFIF